MHPKELLELCGHAVESVLKFDHPADAVLAKFLHDSRKKHMFGARDRFAVTETVYRVLRKKLLFEAFCQSAPKGAGPRPRRLAMLGFPSPDEFLDPSLSAPERDWLKACRAVDPFAADSGLMDRHRHNLPDWLAALLREQLGDGFWPLVQSLEKQAPLDLRVNLLRARPDEVAAELTTHRISASATPYSPWGLRVLGKPQLHKLDVFERGAVEVQDEGSQLLALLLDARRGEMVVDFCAGAGGKTLALGAAMRNTGRLYAFDTSGYRLAALKPRLARSGLSNVYAAAISHERDERVKRLSGKIDRVLVDAPCSGLGTLRRHPDLKWRQTPQAVVAHARQQLAILESAARLLKPGGRLVYATCSLLVQENEAVASEFSGRHADFNPVAIEGVLLGLGVAQGQDLCSGPYLRLWPHRHQTDGFFAACWSKSE
jgi:16S rRNA (cytosine967-C5)-methyltransferase